MKNSSQWVYAKNFDKGAMGANLEAIFSAATKQEIQQGRDWYHQANKFAKGLAKKYNRSVESVIGIISALSPETKYSQNIEDAQALIERGADAVVTTYDKNRDKALKILDGQLDAHEHFTAATNKTAAFYFNILQPASAERVTIDRHSARVTHGYYLTADDAIYYSNTPAKYVATQEVYKEIASKHDLLPHQLQAITWLTYRRTIVPERYQYEDIDLGEIIL